MNTALIAICRDEPNVKEWCLYHQKLGFDTIVVALNNCAPEYVEYCRSLKILGVFFHEFNPPETRIAPQFRFYGECLDMLIDHSHIAFLDMDEYLWLGGKTLPEFLKGHREEKVLAFNWRFFAQGPGDSNEPADSLLKRFTWRQRGFNKHVKPMMNLNRCRGIYYENDIVFVNPHMICTPGFQVPTVTPDGERVRGPYFEGPHATDAWIAHFYSKTKEEFAAKIARGRPDCPRGSTAQYFNCPDHMWAEWDRCNLPEEKDDRLLEFF